MNEEVDGNLR